MVISQYHTKKMQEIANSNILLPYRIAVRNYVELFSFSRRYTLSKKISNQQCIKFDYDAWMSLRPNQLVVNGVIRKEQDNIIVPLNSTGILLCMRVVLAS